MADHPLPAATIRTVLDTPEVKIHTLISPPEFFANTTHVIELGTQVLLVDGQFLAPYAAAVRDLTDRINKPVTRFYVSHDHPDHYLGFGDAFPDVPVYALPETAAGIRHEGPAVLSARQQAMGPLIARTLNLPSRDVAEGSEVIDGVTFEFSVAHDNEAATSLVIRLPEHGVAIVQDIVYNGVHLFIAGPTAGWRKALEALKAEAGTTLILPGHGEPGGKAIVDVSLNYLDSVDHLLAEGLKGEAFKARLLEIYPAYGGVRLFDIYLPILFN